MALKEKQIHNCLDRCLVSNYSLYDNKTEWSYYEEGEERVYAVEDLQDIWELEINKQNFADFFSWISEMEKMQILIKKRQMLTEKGGLVY